MTPPLKRGERRMCCDVCGVLLTGNQKRFCSGACRALQLPRVWKLPRTKNCVDCGAPITKNAERCGSCRSASRIGERGTNWRGDKVSRKAARNRAVRLYPLGPCEWSGGCSEQGVDRHHVDGDTRNNERQNIQILCRRHHVEIDGRLLNLKPFASKGEAA